jgi:membrane protease YdiL (CAAX protease family)
MSTLTIAEPSSPIRPVASARHTIILLGIMASMAVLGARFQQGGNTAPAIASRPNALAVYLPLLISEWAMFLFVWKRGLQPAGTSLREIIGGRWSRATDVVRDVVLAVALWGVWAGFLYVSPRLFGANHARSIDGFLPTGLVEGALWVLLSCSAGFVEEVVYRGYLQRQFAAWTGSVPLALVLQSLVFGVSHGYQGVIACVNITVFALLFGSIAMWRRSLRPGMMAHALTDVLAGLFRL